MILIKLQESNLQIIFTQFKFINYNYIGSFIHFNLITFSIPEGDSKCSLIFYYTPAALSSYLQVISFQFC